MRNLLLSCEASEESVEQLSRLGYGVIRLPKFTRLPPPIASHPDSLVFKGGGRLITDGDYYGENEELFRNIERLSGLTVIKTRERLGNKYPSDTGLNAISIGNYLFCRTDSIFGEVLDCARELGLEIVNTKQGYPACSTLKIAENAVICADKGLSRLYRSRGIRVYEIEVGEILLPPYEYGFIGGASLCLDDKAAFFGDILRHPSAKIICDALSEHSLTAVSLGAGRLYDLGGGILL